jgi:preprotein translocase subunit Sec63
LHAGENRCVLSLLLMALLVRSTLQSSSVLSTTLDSNIGAFDPWAILEVSERTPKKEIRANFRSLSLKWHPDKNKHQPAQAKKEFLKIQKAASILLDDDKKEMFKMSGLYGIDSDSPAGESVGIPEFMADEGAKNVLIYGYAAFFLVGMPAMFFCLKDKFKDDPVVNRHNSYSMQDDLNGQAEEIEG